MAVYNSMMWWVEDTDSVHRKYTGGSVRLKDGARLFAALTADSHPCNCAMLPKGVHPRKIGMGEGNLRSVGGRVLLEPLIYLWS